MGNKLHSFKSLKKTKMLDPSSLILVILGSTGTGKSKLAIELAKKFNGEIISADSMQVYKGLDIVTNKVTPDEQKEAVHHMINYIDPLSRFTVVDFQNQALPIIDKLIKEKKLPIIVGGTNYYIESLLWEVLIKTKEPNDKLLFDSDPETESNETLLETMTLGTENESINVEDLLKERITPDSFMDVPSILLHQALKQVDPVMANMLHPKDRRKVIRSLQVYQQHGQCHSELLRKQRNQDGASSLGGPLRFKNSVMLWLQCEKSEDSTTQHWRETQSSPQDIGNPFGQVLIKRNGDRVEDMISRGLINELLEFHKMYNEKRIQDKLPSYEEGIFQSIGFKEFHEYLILSDEAKNSYEGKKILAKAIEDMKTVTRQYARKQTKWVTNRFLRQPKRQLPPVYGLDATNVDQWNENVLQPAISIIQSLLEKKVPAISPLPVEDEIDDVPETHYCEICDRIFVGRRVWKIHLASKKHSKMKASLKKKEKNYEMKSTASS